jgi:hypothetical protein
MVAKVGGTEVEPAVSAYLFLRPNMERRVRCMGKTRKCFLSPVKLRESRVIYREHGFGHGVTRSRGI